VQAQQPGAPDATAPGRMAEAIERVLAIGTRFRMPTYRVLLVETLLRHGQLVEGLQQAERCRQEIEAQGEYLAHPFLLVARAGLHQAAGDDARALADWQRALEVSRQLGAGSVALRAATGLGTMLARQDRPDQALACVDEALQPFRRDWQNPDLARARALRDRLQGAGRTHLRAV
jgi:tetratricopeptide (TPR) repeat protein